MRCLHWTSFSEATKGSVPLVVVVIIATLWLPSFLDSTMPLSSLKLIICASLAAVLPSNCVGQVLNGEFNDQLAASPDWWYGHGDCSVVRTSQQANEGQFSALVSQRTQHWNGAGQELNGDLTVGKDYHFQCWVRTKGVPSGVVRIEISQDDDRGTRFFPVAKVRANDQQWTLLEGGFHFMVNGTLNDLRFIVGGDLTDDRTFDFYVDSVTITENDWKAAADQRIEQFRKRDVVIEFKDQDGNPISDIEVDVDQIGHRFAFGSTLNDGFIGFDVYRDFFKQNFEWATIEYYAQWKPVEEVQGVEVYDRADASVEFAEANGIKLRGHSLAWPDPRFVPEWLVGQSAEVHRAEINQRIDNVVSRYAGRLVHWDVVNEMLDHTYYQDAAGPEVRPGMFIRARENDPDVKLFTNEFGLTESGVKSTRYRELVQRLQAAGADVGGIGLQSHFDSNVSPKAMELTLAKLTDLGPEIWFTEFDVSNPDPVQRAELLETFYRYAFSVPEAEGIIMWGFWAGNHWRGADSAIVDQDFTINAAGKKYFELIDQWTTNFSTSVSDGDSDIGFRGTHGNYRITTKRNGVESFHVVSLVPDDSGTVAEITLTLNNVAAAEATVMVYGSDGDDQARYDFQYPERLSINGVTSLLNLPIEGYKVRFAGLGGDDKLSVVTDLDPELIVAFAGRVLSLGNDTEIQFVDVEEVEIISSSNGDRLVINDSSGDDVVRSSVLQTEIEYGLNKIVASGFNSIGCRSNRGGTDRAIIEDSINNDNVRTNGVSSLDVRDGQLLRQFFGFENVEMSSAHGEDVVFGIIADQPLAVNIVNDRAEFETSNSQIILSDFSFTKLVSNAVSPQTASLNIDASDSADRIVLSQEIITVTEASNLRFSLRGFSDVNSILGNNDSLILRDSRLDDRLSVSASGFSFLNQRQSFSGQGSGSILAVSRNGGDDIADSEDSTFNLNLIGDWQPAP